MFAGSKVKFEVANHSGTTMPVGVYCDEVCIDTTSVRSGETVSIGGPIPVGAHRLSIYSPSWSPHAISASPDERKLGVAVSRAVFVK